MSPERETKADKPLYYCPDCGSTYIAFDGQVQWDRETQSWDLLEVHQQPWCGGCKDTIYQAVFGEPTTN